MLSYKQALERIAKHSFHLKVKLLPIQKVLGLVISENIFSPEPFPGFDNSAVDGYAVTLRAKPRRIFNLKIQGEIRAGEFLKGRLKPGHAIRIFTGAPVPRGTQAVVMQEHTERSNGHVRLLVMPGPNDNIRFRGEDFSKGTILVKKGTWLGPTHLALLATVGYEKIPVYPSASVAILATGSELVRSTLRMTLPPGKIRDSNSILLESLVKQVGGYPCPFPSVGDDLRRIRSGIRKGLKSDLLLISGGVSVGKYDFVKEVLQREGVKEIFWKVDIKPGKPLFFGKKGRTLVFGLPGNPVSVFVTFMEFVRPVIEAMMARKPSENWVKGRLTHEFQNGSRLHFVRVRCQRKGKHFAITPLKGQGSHMIGSLASSNGLLCVEPNAKLKRNQSVLAKVIGEE